MAATIWDNTRTNANLTLSGSPALIATLSGTGSQDCCTFATNAKSSGRWTFSALINALGAHGINIGLGTSTAPFANGNFLGQSTQTFGYFSNTGVTRIGAGNPGTAQAYVQGNTVWVAVDITAQSIWLRVNNGNWNNSPSANPDTGVGGFSISGMASFSLFPAADLWTAADQVTADFTTLSGLTTFNVWNFIPPAQTVAAFDNATRHWRVTITGATNGVSSAVFHGKGYQTGTYTASGVTGVGGSAQWMASNDGITFVPIGAAITTLPATGVLAGPDDGVFAYYQLVVTAGDGTTSYNAVADFVSQNAS